MGKEIIWSPTALSQLKEIHEDIFEISKSLNIASKVVNDIINSTYILGHQPEIYSLDSNKVENDLTYRSYQIRTYNIAYRNLENTAKF